MKSGDRTAEFLEQVSGYCSRWLDRPTPGDTSLRATLDGSRSACPEVSPERTDAPLLFPLAFHRRPHLTAGLFHQLFDACAEAGRRETHVRLVPLGVGRASDSTQEVSATAHAIARLLAVNGWPVEPDGDADPAAASDASIARRARGLSFTRRAVDLPDLLASAAADAAGTDLVYLSDGMLAGRQLSSLRTIAPLGRRYTAGDPFAPIPPYAKRVPAGSDPVWATALSLGLTDAIGVDDDERSRLAEALRSRLLGVWRKAEAANLTRHHGIATEEPRRLLLTGPYRGRASIPLFGSLRLSPATRSLVAACSRLFPFELVVDDLTPRILYPHFPVEHVRAAFSRLATDYGGTAKFLSDLDPGEFDSRLETQLRQLTVGDLIKASPPGKSERLRGSYSGYDAIHLAVMGVAVALHPDAVTVVQAHNVPAVHVLNRTQTTPSLLARTGPAGRFDDHELRLDPHWLTEPLGVRA